MDLDEILVLIGIGVATIWLEREGYLTPIEQVGEEVELQVEDLIHQYEWEYQPAAPAPHLSSHKIPQQHVRGKTSKIPRSQHNPVSSTGQQSDLGHHAVVPSSFYDTGANHTSEFNEAAPMEKRQRMKAGGLFGPNL